VDAIVLEYHLGLLDSTFVATEIKRVQPSIPIVMLADDLELPDGALNSVDALVTKSDGSHFLWATVHFVLNVKPAQGHGGKVKAQMAPDSKAAPFTSKEWRSIQRGTVRF
jgi:hypothetical protein